MTPQDEIKMREEFNAWQNSMPKDPTKSISHFQTWYGGYDSRQKEIDKLNHKLKEFDKLTDVLTDGYGAASCINPLVDAKNAVAKIRSILLDKDQEILELSAQIEEMRKSVRH